VQDGTAVLAAEAPMANPFEFKLANPKNAKDLFSNAPLGSSSIDHAPVGLELKSGLSFGGDSGGKLTLNARGVLTVAVLNDATDPDEDGILSSKPDSVADDALRPQLAFDASRAYLKYRVEAGVKAAADIPVGALLGIDAAAEASVVFADYRAHGRDELTRDTLLEDITAGRFITHLDHVLAMAPGDALAFRFGGSLSVGVTVSWSDIFTGQIGTLSTLLGSPVPLAISVNAGATVTLSVSVSDDFALVFSRASDDAWRVGVRKVKSSRIAPSVDAGIDVGIANPDELKGLVTATLAGVLGAPLEKVKSLLAAASLESLGPVERKLAKALIERLGLKEELATIEALRKKVEEAEAKVTEVIEKVVKTRIALSFSYEYSRVSVATNVVQATLTRAAVRALHKDLIKARADALADAVRAKRPGVAIERYLNQKEITRSRSFGFTLGFGKWATIGGKDFKKVTTVRRVDLQNRLQESYLGTRLYTGQWVGETQQWGVDLKADMKDYSAEPKVSDYSFGIHLLWSSEQKELSGTELEEWLDSAIVWRVFREEDLVDIRARAAAALDGKASLTVQVTLPHGVLRAMLAALAAPPIDAFAPSLAVAMPFMKLSLARSSAAKRREVYAPLWALYLKEPDHSVGTYGKAAAEHLKKVGHQEMVLRETAMLSGPDPFSFAGLTAINGNTRGACDAFTRGAQILQSAITNGARNQKTIDKVFGEMDDLWLQSHHVRAIGAYLLDAAERAVQLANVTRTMTLSADGLGETLVVTA
jgi:hypothetical protein